MQSPMDSNVGSNKEEQKQGLFELNQRSLLYALDESSDDSDNSFDNSFERAIQIQVANLQVIVEQSKESSV